MSIGASPMNKKAKKILDFTKERPLEEEMDKSARSRSMLNHEEIVIKNRFSHNPIKESKFPVSLDKYGKNHKDEPKYISKGGKAISKVFTNSKTYGTD